MPVTVRFDPTSNSQQAAVIPDASLKNDGVMTRHQVAQLEALVNAPPVPPPPPDIDTAATTSYNDTIAQPPLGTGDVQGALDALKGFFAALEQGTRLNIAPGANSILPFPMAPDTSIRFSIEWSVHDSVAHKGASGTYKSSWKSDNFNNTTQLLADTAAIDAGSDGGTSVVITSTGGAGVVIINLNNSGINPIAVSFVVVFPTTV